MYDHRISEAQADEGPGPLNATGILSKISQDVSPPSEATPASPPPSKITQLSSQNSRPSPGRTVRELAHKLSQQNLQVGEHGHVHPQLQLDFLASPLPSTSATSLDLANLPDLPTLQPWPVLEVDDEPGALRDIDPHKSPHSSLLSVARRRSQLLRGGNSSTGTEEGEIARMGGDRLRKQLSSQFRDRPINTLASKTRVEEMISSGAQCHVQDARPLAASTPTSSSTVTAPARLEPDSNYVPFPMELEVDEAYCNGAVDGLEDDMSLVEAVVSLRRAGAPGGIRKHIVAGVPLRYQLSADAALRCQNVVRSRPRMRRRKKTRPESVTSSAVTSAVSSPVIPPSIPSPHLYP